MNKPNKRGNVERVFSNPTTSDAPVADERTAGRSDRERNRSTGEVNDRHPTSDEDRLNDDTEDRE